jgi:predicted DNA-binding transcriptional regulator YafY
VRAGRLISLVSILNHEGRTTAAELATRLEVSERTVLRDLEVLSSAGVPVYGVRGVGGGFELLEGYTPSLPERTGMRASGRATGRMTVRITEEGRRTAAILGHLQPLRLRPAPDDAAGAGPSGSWVTATCRLRGMATMTVEVLALGPEVEVVAPAELRDLVADRVRRAAGLYA